MENSRDGKRCGFFIFAFAFFSFPLVSPLVYLFGSLLLLLFLLTGAGSAFFFLSSFPAFFFYRIVLIAFTGVWGFMMRTSEVHFALSLFHMEPEVHLVAVWGFRK